MSNKSVTIGGVDHVVGGWVEYELVKSRARMLAGGTAPYGSRSFITEQDVADEMAGFDSMAGSAIRTAVERLMNALDRYNSRGITGTSTFVVFPDFDFRRSSERGKPKTIRTVYEAVGEIDRVVRSFCPSSPSTNRFPRFPEPSESLCIHARTSDADAVRQVEDKTLKYLYELEDSYAEFVRKTEEVTREIETLLTKYD